MAPRNRVVLAVAIALIFAGSLSTVWYLNGGVAQSGPQIKSVLIVASISGFNDSADHGVPASPWPVIQVSKGTMVNITVYNDDKQAHGFQVAHYFDSGIETIAPGQTIHVSFVANETGTFQIYCSIFCTVHWAMQSGELVVS